MIGGSGIGGNGSEGRMMGAGRGGGGDDGFLSWE